jgi:DNA replication protein DnaC
MSAPTDPLLARAQALKLHGLLAHWEAVATSPWLAPLIQWEEEERTQRSLQRRLANAHLGRFKPLADFDWSWPKRCERDAVEELMSLAFVREAANAILIGPNGVGKTTIARNIAYQAVLAGYTVLCTSAGHMLNELAGADGDHALRQRLALYARPRLLLIDEIGYLSYSNRHADLLFEIVSRRYQEKSTLVTTNRPNARVGRGLPQCRLCRLPRRPPGASRRDPLHRGRVLSAQGGQGAWRAAAPSTRRAPGRHTDRR